jgi:hypothetical protein
MKDISSYLSNNVFEGTRTLSPERRKFLLKKFETLIPQEPLGEEFEKILNDNLWELYEDGTKKEE